MPDILEGAMPTAVNTKCTMVNKESNNNVVKDKVLNNTDNSVGLFCN